MQEQENHMFTTKYPDPPTLKPIFDEIREEARAEGEAKGQAEGQVKVKKEVALNMLRKGYAVETVVELTGLTKEEVTALESEW
ncbi:hypothetical protein FH966_02115 [Lentibacillus cibarius]|uniref:Transposase n=1 Tax=Lentibacillus cibarius TaxID=2583219 RepID=A0A549YFE7_9BACI|nr:hypothetical protein [Lentibacillus cibarius]TRM10611.1 hypothetical protein FH966_02115 [Lentibacillus cibarius]